MDEKDNPTPIPPPTTDKPTIPDINILPNTSDDNLIQKAEIQSFPNTSVDNRILRE